MQGLPLGCSALDGALRASDPPGLLSPLFRRDQKSRPLRETSPCGVWATELRGRPPPPPGWIRTRPWLPGGVGVCLAVFAVVGQGGKAVSGNGGGGLGAAGRGCTAGLPGSPSPRFVVAPSEQMPSPVDTRLLTWKRRRVISSLQLPS